RRRRDPAAPDQAGRVRGRCRSIPRHGQKSQGDLFRCRLFRSRRVSKGTVEALPFEVSSFEKVCTVNTVYFWSSLDAGFLEIHRVLSPGGRVVVGFLPKERMGRLGMPIDIFTSRTPESVITALTSAGFTNVRVERPEPTTPWNVIVAIR